MATKSPRSLAYCVLCLVVFGAGAAGSSTNVSKSIPAVAPTAGQGSLHSITTDMGPIMKLLLNHGKIRFTIQDLPNGERTITTSSDPTIANTIRTHAQEMKARLQSGVNIRPSDPLFVEVFRHHTEISNVITYIPGGVSEDETSKNPQVVLLIRAHARAVAQFVSQGMPAARQNYPLPQGYHVSPATGGTGY